MVFSTDPEADLFFAREMLWLVGAQAGGGWLIFHLPSEQSGTDDFGCDSSHQLYLQCRDLDRTIAFMAGRGVEPGPVTDEKWGRWVKIALPGGGRVRVHEVRTTGPPP